MLGALERRFGAQELESSSDLDETTVPPPVASGRGAVATVSAHKSASRGEAEVSSSKQFKPAATAAPGVEKLGSGLLLVNTGTNEVMLLLRNSVNNTDTWGLPGGNRDPEDGSSIDTATREGREELGTVPRFKVRGVTTVVRGKRGQKHYDVHVCDVDPRVAAAYVPKLNHEHSAWKWIPADEVLRSARGNKRAKETWPLHPVVERFFDEHWSLFAKEAAVVARAR